MYIYEFLGYFWTSRSLNIVYFNSFKLVDELEDVVYIMCMKNFREKLPKEWNFLLQKFPTCKVLIKWLVDDNLFSVFLNSLGQYYVDSIIEEECLNGILP